jgi:hypothetical protein
VRALYFDVLGRLPTDGEVGYYLTSGKNRNGLANVFVHSDESKKLVVAGFYAAYLHRPTDPGFDSWVQELAAGFSVSIVEAHIVGEPVGREFYNNGKATV